MTTPVTPDPFDVPASVPSLSFKDSPIGFSYTGTVVRLPELIQARDFETGEKAWWDDAHTEAKMTVVLHVKMSDGQERALWAPKPSSMFAAIADAQRVTGKRMALGDTLTVTLIGEEPNRTNPKLNPAKQYRVVIAPADPFSGDATTTASVQSATSNGHAVAAAAPAVSAPAIDPSQAAAVLGQIRGLIGFGLTDEQIVTTIPAATPEVIAMVRSLPVG